MRRNRAKKPKGIGLSVTVEDGKFEKALRQFKKKCDTAGIVRECRERMAYVKPTTKRKMARNAAKKRWARHVAAKKIPSRPNH